MAQYKTRDPQNPYRTGVLVGNYVEDQFGIEFATKEVSRSTKPSRPDDWEKLELAGQSSSLK